VLITLSQEEQAEQKSEAKPSPEHQGGLGRSQPSGKANVSIDLREESIPFRMVIWHGERPVRSGP
jgi:hypothetical protein